MLYFIINPHSRSGQGGAVWKEVERTMISSGLPYKVSYTSYPGHAIRLAAEIPSGTQPEPNLIAVLGGDGSLNEVLNGAHLSPYTIIGYLPTGSGNDFARGMHLPIDAKKALTHIIHPSYTDTLDFGSTTYGNQENARRFLVSSGIGYDAAVCHRINTSKLKKVFNCFHLGKLAYVILGIEQIIRCRRADGTLTIDDEREIPLSDVCFISCHNLPYEGGSFCFAPDADPHDGEMDLCVVTACSRLRFTWILLNTLLGAKHTRCHGVSLIRCHKAAVKLNRPLAVHTDGEVTGFFKEASFESHPHSVRITW